jgi:uncharacterized protein (DUF2141 family)
MYRPCSLLAVSAWAAGLATPVLGQTAPFEDLHRLLAWDAGSATTGVALGDLDGDGDLDAVFGVKAGFSTIPGLRDRVLLNDGLGRLALAPANLPTVIDDTNGVAVGDLDGDGDLDLLLANDGQERLYVNNGSGVFSSSATAFPSFFSNFTAKVLLGDVDGDGDLDVLSANSSEQHRLYRNDGATVFADVTFLLPANSSAPTALAFGDLDGDGDVDLLGPGLLYLNNGAGFFSNASGQVPFPTSFLRALAVGDLDGDGDLDGLLGGIAAFFPLSSPIPLTVYENDGAAVFTQTALPVAARATSLALGDLEGDGDLDALVGTQGSSGKFFVNPGQSLVALNDGVGGFSSVPSSLDAPPSTTLDVALGDLDGDGDLDAVVGNAFLEGQTNQVYLNDGAGTLRDSTGQVSPEPTNVAAVALGDLDGDGDLDAFSAGTGYSVSGGPSLTLLNDGTGLLQLAAVQPPGLIRAKEVALGDVDGDGDLDALVLGIPGMGSGSRRFYVNMGAASFGDATSQFQGDVGLPSGAAFRDMDGDGDLDAVLSGTYSGSPSNNVVLVRNDGTGAFTFEAGAFPPDSPLTSDFAIGDVDGDGDLDVFAGGPGFCQFAPCLAVPSRLYLNDGSGLFSDASAQLPALLNSTAGVALGDVDGDGDLDAYVGNGAGAPGFSQDRLYLNDGAGAFADATSQLPVENGLAGPVALLDVDGDGDLDAWIAAFPLPQVYLNDGSGIFSDASAALPVGWSSASSLAPGDLDGDGDPDLVLADSGRVRVLSNLSRQLAWRALPRVGKPLTFDIHGPAWGAWFLVAAAGTGNTPLPPLGVIRLDLATLMPQFGGLLDAQGHAGVTYQVPAMPALVGQSLYWQAVVVGPARLTNLERTTFTNL